MSSFRGGRANKNICITVFFVQVNYIVARVYRCLMKGKFKLRHQHLEAN